MKTYQEYCDIYNGLSKDCKKDIIDILNERGVDYINVHAYHADDAVDENCWVNATDKNGYGTTCTIDAIYKNEKGEWYISLVDEDEDPFDDECISDNFNIYLEAGSIIDLYGMILSIFEYADEHNFGRICGKGEDLNDLEEEEE